MPARATALLVAGLAVAACGKYGPPVRSQAEPAPAQAAEPISDPAAPPAPLAPTEQGSGEPEAPQAASEENQP